MCMKTAKRKGRLWRCLGRLLLFCFIFLAGYFGYAYYKSDFPLFEPFRQALQRHAYYF